MDFQLVALLSAADLTMHNSLVDWGEVLDNLSIQGTLVTAGGVAANQDLDIKFDFVLPCSVHLEGLPGRVVGPCQWLQGSMQMRSGSLVLMELHISALSPLSTFWHGNFWQVVFLCCQLTPGEVGSSPRGV